jgi:hypothetical protein
VQLGPANYVPRVEPNETRYEFSEDATWIKNNHTFKFGFGAFNSEDYVYYIANGTFDPNGAYTYNTTTAFAQDYSGGGSGKNWTTFQQQFGNPVQDYKISEYSLYAVDQWKVRPNLTINYGVRWDKSKSLNFPITNPDWPSTGYIHTPNTNFAPRLGLTYRLNDKTVIRGGFGLFYARLLGGLVDDLITNDGLYQASVTLNASSAPQLAAGPAFPKALSAVPTGGSVSAVSIQFADPHIKTPYSAQANITLERQFGRDMVLTASWESSRGIHLYGGYDLNAPTPSSNYTYTITDTSLNPVSTFTTPVYTGARPNTKYGAVVEVTNGVDSLYEGLAITFEKRFSHGIQSLASYTWAHEIDDGQGAGGNAIFFNTTTPVYNGNNSFERGSGSLDQRHKLVHSFVWAPAMHSTNPTVKYLLGNWQLSGITTIASGRPAGQPHRSYRKRGAVRSAHQQSGRFFGQPCAIPADQQHLHSDFVSRGSPAYEEHPV